MLPHAVFGKGREVPELRIKSVPRVGRGRSLVVCVMGGMVSTQFRRRITRGPLHSGRDIGDDPLRIMPADEISPMFKEQLLLVS